MEELRNLAGLLKRTFQRIADYFYPERNGPVVQAQRLEMPHQEAAPPQEGARPDAYGFEQLFASSHADEEQVAFGHVDQAGTIMERQEEWGRDGDTMRSKIKRTMVITVSGEIVSPDGLKGQCAICQGYDSELVHCHYCGRGLCRLDRRSFEHPNGKVKLTLCEPCYRRAWDSFNTWDATDSGKA